MSSPAIPARPGDPPPGRANVPAGQNGAVENRVADESRAENAGRAADERRAENAGRAADERPAADGSSPAGGSGAAVRGRPRSEAADRAILRAATDLLAERGLAGMSMEEVAARAGVGKATVYRRWRSRGALALDAFMAEFQALQPLPDTGTLRGDLLAALRAWVRAVTRTPAGRILAGLIAAAQEDPELAVAWRARVLEPMRGQHRIMLRRAIERGEIPASTDTDVALDLMYGAAYHRLLQGHRPLSDTFTRRVVDVIVTGLGGPPP